ncbi:hypothetical protein [Acinetobacter chinensis]|uniref:hypothetical protein n=1 Tax=Acinetobacter chinensis TaxID=2004650 RepID=UPI0029341320|nr:hypothetical protein [Acinetobacter chinensis]WOE40726.1 hypothetical protein QSG87_12635 [Acinetobacter chinensis]
MLNPVVQQQGEMVQQFSEQDARKLVEDMLLMYGKKFTDQWSGLKKGQVVEKFVEKLSDLTYVQFLRGLKRLDTAEWPPSIPEFKKWCLGGYEYQSSDDAWLQALNYERNNRCNVINKFTKQAFDEVVQPYGHLGSSDTFYKVFSSVYRRIITEARECNEADELIEAVSQLGHSQQETEHKPVSNEVARQQYESFKAKLNVKNRHVPKPQELKPKQHSVEIENPWPDPFDNPAAYLSACDLDGVVVPIEIRRQMESGV